MKRCKACGETKALTEFYTYPSGTVDSWCRPCKRDYEKERSRRRLDAKGRSRPARWSIPPGKKWCNKCRKVLPIAEFHKRQDWCKSCRSAYATATRTRESQDRSNANTRAWRDRNPERVQELNRAYHKERYARDRDGILALNAASYARHRKARIADAKRWAEANPDRRREIVQRWETEHKWHSRSLRSLGRARRYYRRHGITAEYEYVDLEQLWEESGGTCGICGESIPLDALAFDHIEPLAAGGPHIASNLQPTHMACNAAKDSQTRLTRKS